MQTLKYGTPEAKYLDISIYIFIFFLWSMCKIIWMNILFFPYAPRIPWESRALFMEAREVIPSQTIFHEILGG